MFKKMVKANYSLSLKKIKLNFAPEITFSILNVFLNFKKFIFLLHCCTVKVELEKVCLCWGGGGSWVNIWCKQF